MSWWKFLFLCDLFPQEDTWQWLPTFGSCLHRRQNKKLLRQRISWSRCRCRIHSHWVPPARELKALKVKIWVEFVKCFNIYDGLNYFDWKINDFAPGGPSAKHFTRVWLAAIGWWWLGVCKNFAILEKMENIDSTIYNDGSVQLYYSAVPLCSRETLFF